MAGRFGRVRVPRQFASTKKMMDFRDFLFTEPKKPGEEIMLPDEKGGELKLTEVHMLEVEVDGVKIDGAFVSLKAAIRGAIRTFKRVGYLYDRVRNRSFFALLLIL